MRTTRRMRDLRRGRVAAGALIIGIPAVAAGQALAQSVASNGTPMQAKVANPRIRLGHQLVVTGTAPASEAGRRVELQYASAGQRTWSALSSSTIRGDGAYRLAAPVRHSGLVRVLDTSSSTQVATASDGGARLVSVTPSLRLANRSLNVLGGQPVHIRGRLLPGVSGRRVRLEALTGRSWHTAGTGRTGGRGGFDLRYVPGAAGAQSLRVRFAGDRLNTHAWAHAGRVTVYRESLASWYNDGGTTGCGFHATYGVANVSLPCGARVRFYHGGRSVTATVDDRGPYAGGREWDLNQNTAAALGFAGVGSVWSSP